MVKGKSNEKVRTRSIVFSRSSRLRGQVASLMVVLSLFMGVHRPEANETSLPEYQVKALFLFNFAKYVDWPTNAFVDAKTPITIYLIGENKLGDALHESVKGKNINGRDIIIRRVEKGDDLDKCHILFVNVSEKKHLGDILVKTKAKPVLTVSETEQFIQQGGIINFVKKEGKVRLEINVDSAAQSKLQISSKLLSVADVVRGKK